MWDYIGALAIGYLVGSVPFGYFIAAAHGVEISKIGSGSSGGTNIMRALGVRWGLLVMLLDMAKGAGSVIIAFLVTDQGSMFAAAVLFCAMLGHTYPFYLRFRNGGKGVSTLLGGLFILATWQVIIPVFAAWCLGLYRFKTMSKVNLFILAPFIPVGLGITYFSLWWFLVGLGFIMFLYWTHRGNIKRLLRGEEKPLRIK